MLFDRIRIDYTDYAHAGEVQIWIDGINVALASNGAIAYEDKNNLGAPSPTAYYNASRDLKISSINSGYTRRMSDESTNTDAGYWYSDSNRGNAFIQLPQKYHTSEIEAIHIYYDGGSSHHEEHWKWSLRGRLTSAVRCCARHSRGWLRISKIA